MIQELLSLALPIGKFFIASALMVVFYKLLYRGKSTFNASRFYLLTIAVVSILLSQFNIVVYTPPVKVVEIEAPRISVLVSGQSTMSVPTAQVTSAAAPTLQAKEPVILSKFMEYLTVRNVAFTLYGVVTLVLFILFFIQLFKILWYKKKGKVMAKDAFNLVINPKIPTPFSFYKSIFINESITGSKLEMILKHELWHIKHRHFLDVFLIEVIVRIFWFNPVLWWVRRELRNVDEFQTDRSVLDEGHDLYKYQTIILEEVMENNSYLANSFNSSFTKKRFIMMKNTYQTSLATLRRVLYVPFLVVVFSLLSFTVGKSEVRYVEKQTEKSELSNKQELPAVADAPVNPKNDTLELVNKVINEYPNKLNIVIDKLKKIQRYDNLKLYSVDMNLIASTLGIKFDANNSDLEPAISGWTGVTNTQFENTINQLTASKKAISDLKLIKPSNQKILLLRNELGKINQDALIKTIIIFISGDKTKNLSIISKTITFSNLSPINQENSEKEKIVKKFGLTQEQMLKSGLTEEILNKTIENSIIVFSDELPKLIEKLEKLISNYNLQSLKENLVSAVIIEGQFKLVLKNVNPNSFCDEFFATVTKEDLQECLENFIKIKNNFEKLKKIQNPDVRYKGYKTQEQELSAQKVKMKIDLEVERIRNFENPRVQQIGGSTLKSYSPSEYYKNVNLGSAIVK